MGGLRGHDLESVVVRWAKRRKFVSWSGKTLEDVDSLSGANVDLY